MPKGLPHKEHVVAYVQVRDALVGLRVAVAHGEPSDAMAHLEEVERVNERHAPAFSVAEAADRLGVSPPTVKAWIKKELLEACGSGPLIVSAASVAELQGKLERLRETAIDKKQWAALIQHARDEEEMALPGARSGLDEALEARNERVESGLIASQSASGPARGSSPVPNRSKRRTKSPVSAKRSVTAKRDAKSSVVRSGKKPRSKRRA